MIRTTPPGHPEQTNGAMVPDYLAWLDRSRSFEKLGAIDGGIRDLGSSENGAPAERIEGEEFSPISHRLWQRRFASGANTDDQTVTIIGVLVSRLLAERI
jgi:hypothetical protein